MPSHLDQIGALTASVESFFPSAEDATHNLCSPSPTPTSTALAVQSQLHPAGAQRSPQVNLVLRKTPV